MILDSLFVLFLSLSLLLLLLQFFNLQEKKVLQQIIRFKQIQTKISKVDKDISNLQHQVNELNKKLTEQEQE